MLVTLVAGARPNFMKIAPIIKAIKLAQEEGSNIDYRLVHTGQHYDKKMSDDFFEQLQIPQPDVNLGAGGGSQAEQTAAIMIGFEKYLERHICDVVVVVGDVTSTMACAITAKKMCVDVAHVEAGIRSGDKSMPEEINRMVTDSICDLFFTTSEYANQHLMSMGILKSCIHFVGNTMIDTLYQHINNLQKPSLFDAYQLQQGNYFLLTIHRPDNADNIAKLQNILNTLVDNAGEIPIVFPVHPRTKKNLEILGCHHQRLIQADPMNYLEFIYLVKNAKAVITDSGGITEEATVLNIPCITLRSTTERPETVALGTNVLVGNDTGKLIFYLNEVLKNNWKTSVIPPLWDGKTSNRIVATLLKIYQPTAALQIEEVITADI